MNRIRKTITTIAATTLLVGGLASCREADYERREQAQKASAIQGESLEKKNLAERNKRENDPSRVGYVYLLSFGKPFGYYVVKGKVSSSGSQIGPEQEVVCKTGQGESCQAVDSSQDDGTYGSGDPGIFFFLADGTKVETTLDYIYTDRPMSIENVPLLGE